MEVAANRGDNSLGEHTAFLEYVAEWDLNLNTPGHRSESPQVGPQIPLEQR